MFKEKYLIYFKNPDTPEQFAQVEAQAMEGEKFQSSDQGAEGDRLISATEFLNKIDEFKVKSKNELLARIDSEGAGKVMWDLDSIKGLNHTEIAQTFIEAGHAKSVARNLMNLNVDHHFVASELFKIGRGDLVLRYLENFADLKDSDLVKMESEAQRAKEESARKRVEEKDRQYAKYYSHWKDRI